MNSCRNCRVVCNDEICVLCRSRKQCDQCKRYLPDSRFDQDVKTCKACLNRGKHDRVAVEGVVIEHPISTNYANDVTAFLDANEGAVTSFLECAIEQDR